MWIGEQIDEYGIGNGISLIIMANIIARLPIAVRNRWHDSSTSSLTARRTVEIGILKVAFLLALVRRSSSSPSSTSRRASGASRSSRPSRCAAGACSAG